MLKEWAVTSATPDLPTAWLFCAAQSTGPPLGESPQLFLCNEEVCPPPTGASKPFIAYGTVVSGSEPSAYNRQSITGAQERGELIDALVAAINAAGSGGSEPGQQRRGLLRRLAAGSGGFQNVSARDFTVGEPGAVNATTRAFTLPWTLTLSASTPGGGNSSEVSAANATLQTISTAILNACDSGSMPGDCPPTDSLQVSSSPATDFPPLQSSNDGSTWSSTQIGLLAMGGVVSIAALIGLGAFIMFRRSRNTKMLKEANLKLQQAAKLSAATAADRERLQRETAQREAAFNARETQLRMEHAVVADPRSAAARIKAAAAVTQSQQPLRNGPAATRRGIVWAEDTAEPADATPAPAAQLPPAQQQHALSVQSPVPVTATAASGANAQSTVWSGMARAIRRSFSALRPQIAAAASGTAKPTLDLPTDGRPRVAGVANLIGSAAATAAAGGSEDPEIAYALPPPTGATTVAAAESQGRPSSRFRAQRRRSSSHRRRSGGGGSRQAQHEVVVRPPRRSGSRSSAGSVGSRGSKGSRQQQRSRERRRSRSYVDVRTMQRHRTERHAAAAAVAVAGGRGGSGDGGRSRLGSGLTESSGTSRVVSLQVGAQPSPRSRLPLPPLNAQQQQQQQRAHAGLQIHLPGAVPQQYQQPQSSPSRSDSVFVPGVGVGGPGGAPRRWSPQGHSGARSPLRQQSRALPPHASAADAEGEDGSSGRPSGFGRHSSAGDYSLPETGRTRASSRASSRQSRPSSASSALSGRRSSRVHRADDDEEDEEEGGSRRHHRRRRHSDGESSVGGGTTYSMGRTNTGRSDAPSEFSLFARTMAYDPAAGVAARRAADYLASQQAQTAGPWGHGWGTAPLQGSDVAFGGTRAWGAPAAGSSAATGSPVRQPPQQQQQQQTSGYRAPVAASELLQAGNAAGSLRAARDGGGQGRDDPVVSSASPPQQWRQNPALHRADSLGGSLRGHAGRSVLGSSAAASLLGGQQPPPYHAAHASSSHRQPPQASASLPQPAAVGASPVQHSMRQYFSSPAMQGGGLSASGESPMHVSRRLL